MPGYSDRSSIPPNIKFTGDKQACSEHVGVAKKQLVRFQEYLKQRGLARGSGTVKVNEFFSVHCWQLNNRCGVNIIEHPVAVDIESSEVITSDILEIIIKQDENPNIGCLLLYDTYLKQLMPGFFSADGDPISFPIKLKGDDTSSDEYLNFLAYENQRDILLNPPPVGGANDVLKTEPILRAVASYGLQEHYGATIKIPTAAIEGGEWEPLPDLTTDPTNVWAVDGVYYGDTPFSNTNSCNYSQLATREVDGTYSHGLSSSSDTLAAYFKRGVNMLPQHPSWGAGSVVMSDSTFYKYTYTPGSKIYFVNESNDNSSLFKISKEKHSDYFYRKGGSQTTVHNSNIYFGTSCSEDVLLSWYEDNINGVDCYSFPILPGYFDVKMYPSSGPSIPIVADIAFGFHGFCPTEFLEDGGINWPGYYYSGSSTPYYPYDPLLQDNTFIGYTVEPYGSAFSYHSEFVEKYYPAPYDDDLYRPTASKAKEVSFRKEQYAFYASWSGSAFAEFGLETRYERVYLADYDFYLSEYSNIRYEWLSYDGLLGFVLLGDEVRSPGISGIYGVSIASKFSNTKSHTGNLDHPPVYADFNWSLDDYEFYATNSVISGNFGKGSEAPLTSLSGMLSSEDPVLNERLKEMCVFWKDNVLSDLFSTAISTELAYEDIYLAFCQRKYILEMNVYSISREFEGE